MSPNRFGSKALCGILLWALLQTGAAGQTITFKRRATQIDDVSRQTIGCQLDATRMIRQQNQLVDQSEQKLRRHQVRTITILALQQSLPVRARVDYAESITIAQMANQPKVRVTHPVANRSYLVERKGENLHLTTIDGSALTPEEEDMLRRHLSTFGKPNPLAQFLHGQQVSVGSTLQVPAAVAQELLGFTGNDGEADALTLKLARIQSLDGQRCGVFETTLRTKNEDATLNLIMRGTLTIEAQSCRTRAIELEGPVAMSEARGPTQARFFVSTNGTLQVHVGATFGLNQARRPVPTTSR